jgi:hypothetical protein
MLLEVNIDIQLKSLTLTVLPVSGNFVTQSVELLKSPQQFRAPGPFVQEASRATRFGAAITTEARLISHEPNRALQYIINDVRKWGRDELRKQRRQGNKCGVKTRGRLEDEKKTREFPTIGRGKGDISDVQEVQAKNAVGISGDEASCHTGLSAAGNFSWQGSANVRTRLFLLPKLQKGVVKSLGWYA